MRRAGALAALLLPALAATASAQDATGVSQVGSAGRAAALQPAQVSSALTERRAPDQLTAERGVGRAPAQLSVAGSVPREQPQLTRAGQGAAAPGQAAQGPRSAQGVAPLSAPQEGRTAAVARVEGRDRCDPAAPSSSPVCAAVIETRAGEFVPPAFEPLSPEERLLSTELRRQPMLDNPSDPRRVARLLGETSSDRASAAEGVASTLMQPPNPTSELPGAAAGAAATQDAAAQAALAAALAGVLGGQTVVLPPTSPR